MSSRHAYLIEKYTVLGAPGGGAQKTESDIIIGKGCNELQKRVAHQQTPWRRALMRLPALRPLAVLWPLSDHPRGSGSGLGLKGSEPFPPVDQPFSHDRARSDWRVEDRSEWASGTSAAPLPALLAAIGLKFAPIGFTVVLFALLMTCIDSWSYPTAERNTWMRTS